MIWCTATGLERTKQNYIFFQELQSSAQPAICNRLKWRTSVVKPAEVLRYPEVRRHVQHLINALSMLEIRHVRITCGAR